MRVTLDTHCAVGAVYIVAPQAPSIERAGNGDLGHSGIVEFDIERLEERVAIQEEGQRRAQKRAIRQQVASAIEVVVQIARLSDGTRKVTAISEITGMERDIITMQDIFVFEKLGVDEDGRVRGRFRATGIRPKCTERFATSGIQLSAQMFEHMKVVA